jgi:hypothetical protein
MNPAQILQWLQLISYIVTILQQLPKPPLSTGAGMLKVGDTDLTPSQSQELANHLLAAQIATAVITHKA